jgi:hypothetical protein
MTDDMENTVGTFSGRIRASAKGQGALSRLVAKQITDDELVRLRTRDTIRELTSVPIRPPSDPALVSLNHRVQALVEITLEGQEREKRMEAFASKSVEMTSQSTRLTRLALLVSLLAIVAPILVALLT